MYFPRNTRGCAARGVELKWFGGTEPQGFNSHYDSWRYLGETRALLQTLATLETTFDLRIPLHPDRCCGLGRIGDVAMLFNVIIFIIGIYVSLTVIDKILLQHAAPFADITVPVYLGGYLLIAPLLFFLPLGSARLTMKQAKIDFLRPISDKCEQLATTSGTDSAVETSPAVSAYFELDKLRIQLAKEIPVWPFDFKSFLQFAGAIVVPVSPVLGTLLIELGRYL